MKSENNFEPQQGIGGFAYISDTEIQNFYSSINNSENISEHKYKKRKLSKAASAPEPGVIRRRGRPRKNSTSMQEASEQFMIES